MPNSPPRYDPTIFHERSQSPLADMQFEYAALRREFLLLQTRLIDLMQDTVKLSGRLNQLDGGLSILVQQMELSARRDRRKPNGPMREHEAESAAKAS